MRIDNSAVVISGDLTADRSSQGIYVGHESLIAFQVVLAGAPVGTLKMQVSCDEGQPDASAPYADDRIVNWSDFPNATVAVAAAGTFFINAVDVGPHWVRLVYVFSSGTGSFTSARINTKGA